jgi:Kef-type K+ transport system membrane component KefB
MAQHVSSEPVSAKPAGGRRPLRLFLLAYGTMVVVPGVLAFFLLQRASGRAGVPAATASEGALPLAVGEGGATSMFLFATVVIIVAARLAGSLFERLRQPRVIGEIIAGIALGPSLLGAVWPDATSFLFPPAVLPYIAVLAQLGLVLFMFLVGVELPATLLKGRGLLVAMVSHASIVTPLVLGVVAALLLFPEFASPGSQFVSFGLFLGLSMSITAFPVLARILVERGLQQTRLGALVLSCAAIDDVTAWCLLAAVVAITGNDSPATALTTIALAVAFFLFMIRVVRPGLARLVRQHDAGTLSSGALLVVVFAGTLLSSLLTSGIGIHEVFGAFLFGAVMPRDSLRVRELVDKLEAFTVSFLLPLFFVHVGLRTRIGLLGTDLRLWAICGLVLLIAILGKGLGAGVAARMVGIGWQESGALAVLMNCRGLTELVVLNIGLELGILTPTLFTMLVLVALVTTVMTTPFLDLLRIGAPAEAPARTSRTLGRLLVRKPKMPIDDWPGAQPKEGSSGFVNEAEDERLRAL